MDKIAPQERGPYQTEYFGYTPGYHFAIITSPMMVGVASKIKVNQTFMGNGGPNKHGK